jgi:hypothetical protein
LPVHGLLEGAAPPAPSPVVTPPVPGARDAAVARAAAAAPRGTVIVNGEPRGAGAPPPKPKAKSPAPKPKARPKKRVKRESPPPAPVEEATEPLPPAPADNEVPEGAALAPRAFREKLSKALDKLGGRYNLETSPGVRGNLQPAVQVCASGQRDAHYGAVLPALVAVWKSTSEQVIASMAWNRHAIAQTQLRKHVASMAWGARNLIST